MRAGVKDAARAAQPKGAGGEADSEIAQAEDGGVISGRWNLPSGTPRAIKAGEDATKEAPPEAAGKTDTAGPKSDRDTDRDSDRDKEAPSQPQSDDGGETPSADKPPRSEAAEQTDDLLFPTADELRASKAGGAVGEKAAEREGAGGETTPLSPSPVAPPLQMAPPRRTRPRRPTLRRAQGPRRPSRKQTLRP